MATTRTWIGGQGNNQAANPNNWSTKGKPLAGDTLLVDTTVKPYIMNVSGNALVGDTVAIGTYSPNSTPYNFTANLTDQATMNAYTVNGSGVNTTFNLSQQSTLRYSTSSDDHAPKTTINISGDDTAILGSSGRGPIYEVNLNSGSKWTGSFDLTEGRITVNGGANTTFNNNGASRADPYHGGCVATIDTNVIGIGSFNIGGGGGIPARMEFMQSVGSGQSITDGGVLQIDQPNKFSAAVTMTNPNIFMPSRIDLMGLATADSYTYQNDMLNIYSGSTVIDTLRLHDSTRSGFAVENIGSGVAVRAIYDSTNPPVGLPIHV